MPTRKISKNRLKELAKLKQKKFRSQQDLVVVEGERLVRQLMENAIKPLEFYCTTSPPSWLPADVPIILLAPWQMERVCTTQTPQAVAALVPARMQPIKDSRFLVYLDGIREPGNLGTIFRTAAGAGVSGIILSPDCCDLFNPKVIRASMGTVFSLPAAIHNHQWLLTQPLYRIVTCLQDAVSLYRMPALQTPAVVIIGNEAFGASPNLIQSAHLRVTIPLAPGIESLNVAIATGIVLFQVSHEFSSS